MPPYNDRDHDGALFCVWDTIHCHGPHKEFPTVELVVEVLCPRDDGVLDRKPLCRPPLTRTGSAVHDRDVVQGMAHTCVDCVGAAV